MLLSSTLNDTKSSDQYLILYNNYQFEWVDEDWIEKQTDAYVINKDGKVLYSRWSYCSVHGEALLVKNKEDVLDRSYYLYKCEDDEYEDDYISQYCDLYVLYDGSGNTDSKAPFVGYNVEFKKDHFYVYESGFSLTSSSKAEKGDFKYYIENGVLKNNKLNSSDGLVLGAGAS